MTIYLIKISSLFGNILVIVLLLLSGNDPVLAAEPTAPSSVELAVSPERCVALRQGQTCYQQVEFNWRSIRGGDFCLVDTSQNKTLHCWTKINQGRFNYDFQGQQSRHYALRVKGSSIDLAEQKITVAWVYKSPNRPKASWRLF
jgi:hypothetical protein